MKSTMKKSLAIVLSLVMMLSMLSTGFVSVNAASVTEISTEADLKAIANNLSGDYVLANDITLSGDWTAIGTADASFTGTFDGAGYTISGLNISVTTDYVGLFGYNEGTIKDVTINFNSVQGGSYVGVVAGYNAGIIYDVDAVGNGYGSSYIIGVGTTSEYIGGFVGYNAEGGIVVECSVSETSLQFAEYKNEVVSTHLYYLGGLVGYNAGDISYSYSLDTYIELLGCNNGCYYIGGIVGYNSATATLEYCYHNETLGKMIILCGDSYVGTIAGCNYGEISACYSVAYRVTGYGSYLSTSIGANYNYSDIDNYIYVYYGRTESTSGDCQRYASAAEVYTAISAFDGYTYDDSGIAELTYEDVEDPTIPTTPEVVTHTVTFKDGTTEITTVDVTDGNSIDLADYKIEYEKENYVFVGWSDDETTYTTSYTPTADITLYAVWASDVNDNGEDDTTEEKFTVTFMDDEKEISTIVSLVNIEHDISNIKPTDKDDYVFVGWNDSETTYTDTYTVTKTITLNAVWADDKNNNGEADEKDDSFTVTYTDGVNGTVFEDKSYTVLTGLATPTYEVTATREGYVFTGWDKDLADKVEANATYTATWAEDVNGNGEADEKDDSFTVTYTDGVNGTVFEDKSYTVLTGLATPTYEVTATREGYVFTGWDKDLADKVEANATYTATWAEDVNGNGEADEKDDSFTVTYTDGVNGTVFEDKSYTVLTGLDTPTYEVTATREGYVFTGWDKDLADKVEANATYTAQWSADVNGNGVADSVEDYVTYDENECECEEGFVDKNDDTYCDVCGCVEGEDTEGGDSTGSEGGDNTGSEGGDNTGSEGGDNTGSEGGDNTGSEGGDSTGSEGGDNTGSEGGDNTGSEGGDSTGSEGGDSTGSEGGDNTGSEGGDNTGSEGGNTGSDDDTDIDSNGCNCICHKTGWWNKLWFNFLNFFWDLFNINRVCSCGVWHYVF